MSVQETDAPNLVEIYPNPVSDIINVKTKEDVQCVRIYDTNGKLIKSFNEPNQTIALDDLPSGNYILSFQINEKKENHKILIQ